MTPSSFCSLLETFNLQTGNDVKSKKKKYTREKFKKRKKRRNRNIIEGTEFGKEAMCRAKVI